MKKNKFLKRIIMFCIIVIVIEIIAMFIMYLLRERKLVHVEDLYDIKEVSDGYVAVGISDFHDSKFVQVKEFEYMEPISKKRSNIIATQARFVKYDQNMNIIWEKTFDCEYDSTYYHVLPVSDGYVVVGSYISKYSQIDDNVRDALIIKYDLNGNVLWNNTYKVLSDTEFYKAIDDGDGNVVVIGQSIYQNMQIGSHMIGGGVIVRYDKDGQEIAHNNYGGNKSGKFNDIIKVDDGYIICGKDAANYGILLKFKTDFDREEDDYNLITRKVMWQRTYSNTDTEGFMEMARSGDKIYCVGAINISNEKDEKDETIYKYDAGIVVYNVKGKYLGKYSLGDSVHHRFESINIHDDKIYVSAMLDVDSYANGGKQNSMIMTYKLVDDISKLNENILNKKVYEYDENYVIHRLVYLNNKMMYIGTNENNCGIKGCDYKPLIEEYKEA